MVGKDQGLTLRFFGAQRPAIVIYFDLVDIKEMQLLSIKPKFYASLSNVGNIEGELRFSDQSGEEMSGTSYKQTTGNNQREEGQEGQVQIQHDYTKDKWI